MAKKEYFKLIYLRQEDEDGDYWYAVHSSSRHAEVAVRNNPSIRGLTATLITFKTVEDAEALMNSGSLPDMGGVWEVVSKWVPKPVSGAQRSLSAQYCQKKRQLAGIKAMAHAFMNGCPFHTATNRYNINKGFNGIEAKLDARYAAALKELKEKEND